VRPVDHPDVRSFGKERVNRLQTPTNVTVILLRSGLTVADRYRVMGRNIRQVNAKIDREGER
jgi:hypothetical protein